MTLGAQTAWLACPVCGQGLRPDERTLRCPSGHAFDLAKQGYANLLGHAAPKNADTPDMVAAREAFLSGGRYSPIADAVARRIGTARRVLEVGAGTGYYLAAALGAQPDALGLATDVSVAATRKAAKAHPRMAAVVADTWAGLPMRSSAVDAVLCVFAPRNPAEFARVLSPGGELIVVTPDAEHLASLRATHGLLDVHADKLGELRRSLIGFEPIATQHVAYRADLSSDDVRNLIAMGPNAFHTTATDPDATTIDVSVHVSLFRLPVAL